MCVQIDWVWDRCGHRCFAKFDTCLEFGRSCFGASGDHREHHIDDICADCKVAPKITTAAIVLRIPIERSGRLARTNTVGT